MNEPHRECCAQFAKAHTVKTDNEGYGALISSERNGETQTGVTLDAISFCPWCGHLLLKKPKVTPEQQAAIDLQARIVQAATRIYAIQSALGRMLGELDHYKVAERLPAIELGLATFIAALQKPES